MDWRKKNRMDTILEEWKPPEVLLKYFARGKLGFDKDGFPITFNLVSYMDFKGIYIKVSEYSVAWSLIYVYD